MLLNDQLLLIIVAAVAELDDGPLRAPMNPSPWKKHDSVVRDDAAAVAAALDEDQKVQVDNLEVERRSATIEQLRKKMMSWPNRSWGG